jgi:hypothetical protein
MLKFLIKIWMSTNCIGSQIGSIVVQRDQCVEPPFGLGFTTNGSYILLGNNCSQREKLNIVRCEVEQSCCYVPEGMSLNITSVIDLPLTENKTQTHTDGFPLPVPTQGRRFVCVEQ